MIEPDTTIRFSPADVPCGCDGIPSPDSEAAARQAALQERRKEENLRWLQEHCDFKPFGGEW